MTGEEMTAWLSHFSPPRPFPDPRLHAKGPFPPPELVQQGYVVICSGDLGLPVRVIQADAVPPTRDERFRRVAGRHGVASRRATGR